MISAVETGTLPSSGHAAGAGPANEGKLVREVIDAAYSAFYSGLHAALLLSAGLVFAAGIFSFVFLAQRESALPAARREVVAEPDRAH